MTLGGSSILFLFRFLLWVLSVFFCVQSAPILLAKADIRFVPFIPFRKYYLTVSYMCIMNFSCFHPPSIHSSGQHVLCVRVSMCVCGGGGECPCACLCGGGSYRTTFRLHLPCMELATPSRLAGQWATGTWPPLCHRPTLGLEAHFIWAVKLQSRSPCFQDHQLNCFPSP